MDNLRSSVYGLLRSSERFFKTDMVYVGSGGFWLFFGQAVTVLASLGLAVAFANLVEPEKYGNYRYVLALASIIGAFTLTGLTTAVTRATARGHEGTLRYAFRLSMVWSIGMVFIALGASAYYFLRDNFFLSNALLIVGATAPIITAASLYRPFLMGKKAFKKAALFGIAQSLIPTLSVLLGVLLKWPLLILIALYFATSALAVSILYVHAKRFAQNDTVDPKTDFLGKHLSVIGIIGAVGERLDSILIFQLLGGTELAIFSLATTLPDTLRGSLKNVDALAMPKFVTKTKKEMKRAVWSKTTLIFLATLIVTTAYIAVAPTLFSILFPQYLQAIPYSQLYALILPMTFVLASAYFDAQAAVKERYILRIVNTITKITSVVIGIYFWGIWGAIIARIFSRAINAGLSVFFIARN